MRCSSCGTDNPDTGKFCQECGQPLARGCPSCGHPLVGTAKFCGECGAQLTAAGAPPTSPETKPPTVSQVERRTCSVLFVDLVGFTTLSEQRDSEDVRELLSRYFDTARTVVSRYGGTVEKFIGDAVMAVWGTPTAHEDDAERAVRAALDLVDAVAAFGDRVGLPSLQARGGVVTGEVTVNLGAVGEGMVAGDAVNTAARIQTAAEPGTVLVNEHTRQAAAAAIHFTDAGSQPLKGKADPVRLWQAARVVGTIAGSERVDGLEAGFLGRERELRLVKEFFHASAERPAAQLVSVVGTAGVGKSRLRWEFEKYADGLADTVLWHSGRCLSYGDGVAYWALAEMVRQRFGIAEDEPADSAAGKFDDGLRRWLIDEADRAFAGPRLGALLGRADPGLSREELFAGWRLFFERLAAQHPVVLAFEDLHWADPGLLDFVEHLLEWSADHPVFVLTLARPELADRHPGWTAGRRNAATLSLEPLTDGQMGALLDELVPGLPAELRGQIVDQADGVPLYAVETVRSLIDQDLVQPVDGVYRLVGRVDTLTVPASLSSLIAARLDALPATERELVQDLAVLGGTFPRQAVVTVSRLSEQQIDELLADLVRREILAVRSDRLSPERGQYTFTQSLLRTVAYDTLSRRERKARHLAVAGHLRQAFPDDGADVAEVIARHYQDALQAAPDDPDAGQVRVEAVNALTRAGSRALGVGAPETAEQEFAAAAALAEQDDERTALLERAGAAGSDAGRPEAALALYQQAADNHRAAGRTRDAARLAAPIGRLLGRLGRNDEAVRVATAALDVLGADTLSRPAAELHRTLGHVLTFAGRLDEASPHIERALTVAEALELPDVLADAANGRGIWLYSKNRYREALAMYEWLTELAEASGLTRQAEVGHSNAADLRMTADLPGASEHFQQALTLARRLGDGVAQTVDISNLALVLLWAGRWGEARQLIDGAAGDRTHHGMDSLYQRSALLHGWRGELTRAAGAVDRFRDQCSSEDAQARTMAWAGLAAAALAGGDLAEASRCAAETLQGAGQLGLRHESFRQAWPDAVEAALQQGQVDGAARLVDFMARQPPGYPPPYLRAELSRFRARLAAARDQHDGVDDEFRAATHALRELGYPYHLARALTDHAGWLLDRSRPGDAAPLLTEAVAALEPLAATPALDRARALLARCGQPAADGSAQYARPNSSLVS